MARRRRDLEPDTVNDEARADLERQIRRLHHRVIWPYRTDRATAGGTSPEAIDDSPYSLRRAAMQGEFAAERERLDKAGVPLAEQLELLTEWWDAEFEKALEIKRRSDRAMGARR